MTKKNIKLPKSVKIGPHTYNIKEDLPPEGGLYGSFQSEEGIRLDPRMASLSHKQEVILHEILHSIVLNFIPQLKDEEAEEQIVTVMANSLVLVLKDNPELVEFLTEE